MSSIFIIVSKSNIPSTSWLSCGWESIRFYLRVGVLRSNHSACMASAAEQVLQIIESRSCRARFPADHGRLDAAVESRQLNRILACLAALARLGVTPRFARPKHLASLGRVTALPRFARPGLALQVVKLCGCRIRGITCPAASKMRGRLTSGLPSSRLLFAFWVLSEWRPGLATTC